MNTLGSVSALGSLVVLAGATAFTPVSYGLRDDALPKKIDKSQSLCPSVSVSCRDVQDGEPTIFSAVIKDGDPAADLSYTWTVVGGTIIEGQGTPSIKVKSPACHTVTATLKIGGFDPSCASTASCTLSVRCPPLRRRFVSYQVPSDEETKQLANFAEALNSQPGATGYILFYAPRGGSADDAKAIADRAKVFLISERNIPPDRIVTVKAGFKDQLTIDLWMVPTGATPPTAAEAEDKVERTDLTDMNTATKPTGR